MAFDTDLTKAIDLQIQPSRDSETKPPFTQEQLIIMAIVMSGRDLTGRQIVQWQASTFKYYGELVCASFWTQHLPEDSHYPKVDEKSTIAAEYFNEHKLAMRSYTLPLTDIEHDDTNESSWTTSSAAGWTILRDLVTTKSLGTFRFIDLPAELRTKIYEMVLQFPPSGLKVMLFFGRPEEAHGEMREVLHVGVTTRDYTEPFSIKRLIDYDSDTGL